MVEDALPIEVAVALEAVAVDACLDDAPEAEVAAAIDVVVIEPAAIVEVQDDSARHDGCRG